VGAVRVVDDRRGGPVVGARLATIFNDLVPDFAASPRTQLDVLVRFDADRISEVAVGGVEDGDRVFAVVSQLLVGGGGEQLQEPKLLAVRLVRELESRLDIFTQPSKTTGLPIPVVLLSHAGLGQNTCRFFVHVALNHNCIVNRAFVRIHPILSAW